MIISFIILIQRLPLFEQFFSSDSYFLRDLREAETIKLKQHLNKDLRNIYTKHYFISFIQICVIKIRIRANLRGLKGGCLFEGWALIRGRCLFDNPMSMVGAYSMKCLRIYESIIFPTHCVMFPYIE